MSLGDDFFGGADRTRGYDESASAQMMPAAEPSVSGDGAVRPPRRGAAADALRAAVEASASKPTPPKKRLIGGKAAQAQYERDLAVWEKEQRAARVRRRQRGVSRSVLVTNTKGGVGKTPTVLCLAAALGELMQGGTVAAWEAAEERGTLLNRVSGDPGEGLVELLHDARKLAQNPSAVALDRYAATLKTGARVFGSPAERDVFTAPDIETIHELLSRTYELTIIDSANMIRSAAFRQAVKLADAVVVPTVISVDSATRMLETIELFESGDPVGKVAHRPELLDKLTVVITDDGRSNRPEAVDVLRSSLEAAEIAYVEVPYDKHIAEGLAIEWDKLSEASRERWLEVAAQVLDTVQDTGR